MNSVMDLMEKEFERGREQGKQEASAIQLGESNYGATHSALVVIEFTGFKELRDVIRDRRWRRCGDNPGQAYMGTCQLLAIHRNDYGRTAILICATHYDV